MTWSLNRMRRSPALSLKGPLGDIRTQEGKYLQKAKVPVFTSEEQIPSGLRILGADPWGGEWAVLDRQRRKLY